MRILQICPDSYMEIGGFSVHVKNISERLARKHDVTVYATNAKLLPRFEVKNGVLVERFRCYAPSNAYFFSLEMLLRMRKVSFDVVHGHGYHAFPSHLSTLVKCKKLIVTPHFHGVGHTAFRSSLVRLLKPFGERTLQKAYKIIAVSEYEKSLICRMFKIRCDKVEVIPNGVNCSEFASLKKQNRGFRSILYVGYLTEFKGAQYLIEVLPKLAEDVVLEIVGTGPLMPHLEKLAHELGVAGRVIFCGNLSRRELLQKYADVDVFALLSRYEAYSIVVAEALAAGTPCIVARASALQEWVDSETCFGLAFPIDIVELAKRVNYFLENGMDSKAARKWFGKKILDWGDVAKRIEHIYYRARTV